MKRNFFPVGQSWMIAFFSWLEFWQYYGPNFEFSHSGQLIVYDSLPISPNRYQNLPKFQTWLNHRLRRLTGNHLLQKLYDFIRAFQSEKQEIAIFCIMNLLFLLLLLLYHLILFIFSVIKTVLKTTRSDSSKHIYNLNRILQGMPQQRKRYRQPPEDPLKQLSNLKLRVLWEFVDIRKTANI